MPRLKEPSLKMKKFVAEYINNGGKKTAAYKKAYDTKGGQAAKNAAQDTFNKPMVQKELKEQLRDAGITEQFLHERLMKSITAGEGIKATQATTNQALTLAYKLYNAFPASKSLSMHLSAKTVVLPKNVEEIMKTASETASTLQDLVSEFKK